MYTEDELDDLANRIKQSGLLNPIIMDKKKTSNPAKEYIKFDKSKFAQFTNIINNTADLENLFIEFLKSRNRNSSLNNFQKGGAPHAVKPKGS
jgi:5-methylcytosine-specific restriction endonuclease McrBC regulatory subunit McrC